MLRREGSSPEDAARHQCTQSSAVQSHDLAALHLPTRNGRNDEVGRKWNRARAHDRIGHRARAAVIDTYFCCLAAAGVIMLTGLGRNRRRDFNRADRSASHWATMNVVAAKPALHHTGQAIE